MHYGLKPHENGLSKQFEGAENNKVIRVDSNPVESGDQFI